MPAAGHSAPLGGTFMTLYHEVKLVLPSPRGRASSEEDTPGLTSQRKYSPSACVTLATSKHSLEGKPSATADCSPSTAPTPAETAWGAQSYLEEKEANCCLSWGFPSLSGTQWSKWCLLS